MAISVEAVYEDGVLKPAEPLPFREHQRIRITLEPEPAPLVQAYGIMGWSDGAAVLERFALDWRFDPEDDARDPLADVIGIGESGRGDGAAEHDRHLHGRRS